VDVLGAIDVLDDIQEGIELGYVKV
jgi:hypothetical protein